MNPSSRTIKLLSSSFLVVFLAIFSASPVAAQAPSGKAVVTETSTSGGLFDYSVLLTNTSSTATIGTFWYSWIPGQSYLADAPTNIVNPTGWNDSIITPGGPDAGGYSIMWTATSPLAAGGTEPFEFTSPETPAQLAGNSPFFSNPTASESTFFLYSGAAFATPSFESIATVVAVPEPKGSLLFLVGLVGLFVGWSRISSRVSQR
jgi:hypothetical protein